MPAGRLLFALSPTLETKCVSFLSPSPEPPDAPERFWGAATTGFIVIFVPTDGDLGQRQTIFVGTKPIAGRKI